MPDIIPVSRRTKTTQCRAIKAIGSIFTGHRRCCRIRACKPFWALEACIMSLRICICSIATRHMRGQFSWRTLRARRALEASWASTWSVCFSKTWYRVRVFVRTAARCKKWIGTLNSFNGPAHLHKDKFNTCNIMYAVHEHSDIQVSHGWHQTWDELPSMDRCHSHLSW